MKTIKRTERGWAGHYILADRCLFRRNTLLEYNGISIVISTVGLSYDGGGVFERIGIDRYFETMAFHSKKSDKRYMDADEGKQISFDSNWCLNEIDADDKANEMHEAVIKEITGKLKNGDRFCETD